MKHSVFTKFMAILLAACALTVALGSAVGVVALAETGLYSQDYETWEAQFYDSRANTLATCMAESYCAREWGGLTDAQLDYINWGNSPERISQWYDIEPEAWCYTITAEDGSKLESNYDANKFPVDHAYSILMTVNYPVKTSMTEDWDQRFYFSETEGTAPKYLYLRYEESPVLEVTVCFAEGSITRFSGMDLEVFRILTQLRYWLIAAIAAGLLLAAACIVYLCCAAGKKRSGDTPQPGGLNRLPLDAYAVGAGVSCFGLLWVAYEAAGNFLYDSSGFNIGWFYLGTAAVLLAVLCAVGVVFAIAAQWKMHGFYIWHHSLVGWCGNRLWKLAKRGWKGLCKLYGMLPLIGRYLLIGFGMGAFPLYFFYRYAVGRSYWMLFVLLSIFADAVLICYGAYAYGTVLKGAQKMADGSLYAKIDTKYLIGSYKKCAENLNALADVAVVAAKNQMKSDRMKTELITNVSHDIKTPLTSIINYIDLLQKADEPEQTQQYLEVLDRQSQRLKKLIDDLMEMSKATTGNITPELAAVDAAESVNQALGEFSDKLLARELTVVLSKPEQPAIIQADGRLTWRVLSNLLSNVVKYALPGTRVYVDLVCMDGQVQLSLKNISREELNVSAQELTERFVRGDASRTSEGSGLGLNIAKSLMELQKGRLDLTVDGDLFKVILTFPGI